MDQYSREFIAETGAASCLLLILAAIIYWQIREIDRVLSEAGSDADDLNFELLSHISPIGWDNGDPDVPVKSFLWVKVLDCEACPPLSDRGCTKERFLQRSGPGRVFKGLGVAKRYCKTNVISDTFMQC